ncbi:Outer membrane protein OmpA [Chitinophaga costaii]|uniref:Outer membrane protein OmpA n=1 Tax=Chitinophaga costaii TaxID=1335309 RepID=A0A1C4EES1_9BACT|nr:OmpA family protein [Chitinophaga costaii]PUZ23869.1 DUF937 domain-containing protein [Chitinophaga costaii]SCC42099.1 Outer membrane protein OmpA [Chitinophaga costaii]
MAFHFVTAIKKYLPENVVAQAAQYYGETPANVQKGIDAIIPVSLLGLLQQVEGGHMASLVDYSHDAFKSGILENVSNVFNHTGGGIPSLAPSLLSEVFGSRLGTIANSITTSIGLKGSTTSALLGTILPLALAVIHKHVNENDMSAGAIASLLAQQKKEVASSVPPEINLQQLLGDAAPVINRPNGLPATRKTNWAGPLLIGLLLIIGVWYWLRSCNQPNASKPISDTITTTDHSTGTDTVVTLRSAPLQLTLPNGVKIDALKGGIEDRLIAFIKDPYTEAGKDIWFDFNTLNFTFGTANILPSSRTELENIAQILKAYPKVKIKIGGYTDRVGEEAANKKLSQARAEAVAKALREEGVGSQVTGAEGYGSQYAKYAADAPEADRIKDRRISVSVREK